MKHYYSLKETYFCVYKHTVFSTNYGFPTKDVDVDPPSVTWGSIYKIKRQQTVHYFFIWNRCGWKLLNNCINVNVQVHHTLIVQNLETLAWRRFRSHADCAPSLFAIEIHNPS